MDPTPVFCPHTPCHARGHTGQGHSGLHSPKEQRFLCHACHHTCRARTGTVFYRRRTSAETGVLVVTVLAHGCPVPALVAALGFDERPVAAWWARSGRQGQTGQAYRVAPPRELGQGQADALRVQQQGGRVWMALALRVKPRGWLGGEVRAQRARPLLRRLRARVRRWAAPRPLLVWTAGVVSSSRALRETWRKPGHTGTGGRPWRRPWRHVCMAQGVKRSERRRGVETARRRVDGAPARVEPRRRRSQGDGVSTTADSERLHATCRAHLAPLARRCRALVRPTLTLPEGMCVVGTVSHLCPPHASWSQTRQMTSAMAAGSTDHGWTRHALLSLPVPLPRWAPPKWRGRPSRALQRLIERWGS
jgi:transposase-like protein